MTDRKKALPDEIPNIGFNLKSQEQFVKDKGIVFEHWAAIPSPIGLKDRGEYRRSESLDTISSNGFLYKKVGEFTALIVSNSTSHQNIDGGIHDQSTARLILPKFYNEKCPSDEKEIALLPGDRVYAKKLELRVDNYQRAEYNPKGDDFLQFPALCVSQLIDSDNKGYTEGRHFKVSKDGNVKWIQGRKNPGIDVDTGKGRIYSIRYTYLAFWYVQQLVNEIRVTNEGDSSSPTRLPYHATIQREYIYHNKTKGDKKDTNNETIDPRTNEEPKEKLDPNQFEVKVDVRNFGE